MFVIEVSGKKDSVVLETVKNLSVNTARDFVTEVDEKSVILVKVSSSPHLRHPVNSLQTLLAETYGTGWAEAGKSAVQSPDSHRIPYLSPSLYTP